MLRRSVRYSPAYAIINLEARASPLTNEDPLKASLSKERVVVTSHPIRVNAMKGSPRSRRRSLKPSRPGSGRKLYEAMQVYLKAKDCIVQLPRAHQALPHREGYPARPQTSVVRQSHQIPCPPQLSRCWRAAASIGAVDISCAARRSSWRWSIWVSSPSLTTRRPPQ